MRSKEDAMTEQARTFSDDVDTRRAPTKYADNG